MKEPKQFYPELFKKAIDEGDETMFGIDLISHGCLTQMHLEMESRQS